MANDCSFNMKVKGTKENIEQFTNMMLQNGNIWMGKGAKIHSKNIEEGDDKKYCCVIDGDTNWSIRSSLIDDAISMRSEPDIYDFDGTDKAELSFVTLLEACEKLQLDMEAYSEEASCKFQEHFLFLNGELITEECVHYEEEYDEEADETKCIGGFEHWNFAI